MDVCREVDEENSLVISRVKFSVENKREKKMNV